jgi:ribonucleoside-triphosphate reductase
MRDLEDIEKDLAAAVEALSGVEGTPAEVYSRIVGYYRSVRNWNRGKREEYGERKLFRVPENSAAPQFAASPASEKRAVEERGAASTVGGGTAASRHPGGEHREEKLLLFVRSACPACPGAKAAAGKLGIPVDTVNADTEHGMEEAVKRRVFSTPTAILLARDGRELGRALDAGSIGKLAAV